MWLEKEAKHVVSSGALADLLWEQCTEDVTANTLSAVQEHLVGFVCKLPDIVAGRMGRETSRCLLPQAFFSRLATCVYHCLEKLHSSLKGRFITGDRTPWCVYVCVCVCAYLSYSQLLVTAQCCLWPKYLAGLVCWGMVVSLHYNLSIDLAHDASCCSDTICKVVVPLLEHSCQSNPLWQRICQKLFSRVPNKCLESLLSGILSHVTP